MTISSLASFSDKNSAFWRGTKVSLSQWIRTNHGEDCFIFSKLNPSSRKLSSFLFLFFSEGDDTSITPKRFVELVCSRKRRIADHPSEWPTRHISSSLLRIAWRSISYTHSEQIGFSGAGIGRAHAYMSLFSNSHISHGRHHPFGLPSKPWIIKTFFIVLWCPRRDSNPHTLRNRLLKPACLPFHHLGGFFL